MDRRALLAHLTALQSEAATQLAALNPDNPPTDLTDRFITWASAR
ncbi:hypothetical protein ACTFTM_19095 [Micromonospora sp. RB23]